MGVKIKKYFHEGGLEKKKIFDTAPTNVMGIMVASEIPAARLKSNLKKDINTETNIVPPPIPIPALKSATKKPSRFKARL